MPSAGAKADPTMSHRAEQYQGQPPIEPNPLKQPRQGRVHFNPNLAKIRPFETIPHATEILLALNHRRFLSARQISRLFFRGESEMIADLHLRTKAMAAADRQANRRSLRPLKDLRLVTVVRPFVRGETVPLAQKEVVVLTAQGAEVARQLLANGNRTANLRWRSSWLEIDGTNQAHASLISDFYIAVRRATGGAWALRGWRDDRDLAQLIQLGQSSLGGLIPDAALVLEHDGDFHPLFLEIDLGTESVVSPRHARRDVTAKFERYQQYLSSGWQRDPLLAGIDRSPIVLFLTTSTTRLNHLLDAATQIGAEEIVCFATLDRLRGDLDPSLVIWGSDWICGNPPVSRVLPDILSSQVPSLATDEMTDHDNDWI